MNVDGTDPVYLTNNYYWLTAPHFSEDEKMIVFVVDVWTGGEFYYIHVISTDGTNNTRITHEGIFERSPIFLYE
jgi:hypothetical protein